MATKRTVKPMRPERIERQEIGDTIILDRKDWNKIVKWLRRHGVEVEDIKQRRSPAPASYGTKGE